MANELPGLSGAIRRFTAAAAVAVGSAVLIAGCSAGQSVQTVNQRPPIDGASTDAGAISIRTASLASADVGDVAPKGGTALLRLVIINNGPQQVDLQSVSSPVAGNAQVSDAGLDQTLSTSLSALPTETGSSSSSASGSTTASGSATASGSSSGTSATASATAPPSASSSETPSGSASASTPANSPISIPPGQSVQVGFSSIGPTIALTGLTAQLYPAQTVPVSFTFSDGSTVNLDIPVALPSNAPSAPVISDATEASEPND